MEIGTEKIKRIQVTEHLVLKQMEIADAADNFKTIGQSKDR